MASINLYADLSMIFKGERNWVEFLILFTVAAPVHRPLSIDIQFT